MTHGDPRFLLHPWQPQVEKLQDPDEVNKFKAKLRFRRALAQGEPGPEHNLEAALTDAWRWKRLK